MKKLWGMTAISLTVGVSLLLNGCSGPQMNAAAAAQAKQHQAAQPNQQTKQEEKAAPAFTGAENEKELPDGTRLAAYKMVDGVKEFEITAQPTEWETEKGKKQVVWSYNGTVPGPQIRVKEGEKVRIVFHNQLPEDSVMHWHGLHVPNEMDGVPGVTQDAVKPGETFVYEFTAKPAGTHMYHTHANTLKQVDKGLFGTFIVEPKEEKKDFDREYTMMLSDGSLGYLINGKSFPDTQVFPVKVGEKVRVRLANVGNQVHPFHLHGHSFKIVAKDGHDLPETAQTIADTVDLMPGDRYDIEFTAQEKGKWLFHCHVLSHVHGHDGKDTGMIQVFDIQ